MCNSKNYKQLAYNIRRFRDFMPHHLWTRALLAGLALHTSCLLFLFPVELYANSSSSATSAAEFLYRVAVEYRQEGRLADAREELRKALLIDPKHEAAARDLAEIQGILEKQRGAAMDQALGMDDLSKTAEAPVPMPEIEVEAEPLPTAEALPTEPLPLESPQLVPQVLSAEPRPLNRYSKEGATRIPDKKLNGIEWFYVFGEEGNPDYGALGEPLQMTIQLPEGEDRPLHIQVLDADTRGKRDEMSGSWNTTTAIRVKGVSGVLDEVLVGPEEADGTTVNLGPFGADKGLQENNQSLFQVEVEGLSGDDNNLFAFLVSPASAQCYVANPAVRLPEEKGAVAKAFVNVPENSRYLVEANYDLDSEGGRVCLVRRDRAGRVIDVVQLDNSGSESWSTSSVDVPPEAAGAQWTYRIVKGDQREANMAFRILDDQGSGVPISMTKNNMATRTKVPGTVQDPTSVSTAPRATKRSRSCGTYTFDGSASRDPDDGRLTHLWDFGDGTTAKGSVVTHTYEKPGTYRVIMGVMDDSCLTCGRAQLERTLIVSLPPQAELEAPQRLCSGAAGTFSAAKSVSASEGDLTYRWDFGDGITAEGAEVNHAYTQGGTHTVTLVVDDGRGGACSTDTQQATVFVNSPPRVQVEAPPGVCKISTREKLEVTLSAVSSDDPDGDALTYEWDLGDGSRSNKSTVSHVYERGGRYSARVTVDDGQGTSCSVASATVPVQVNYAPVAVIDAPGKLGCPGEEMAFDAGQSSDPDGDALFYQWEFGDGEQSYGATVRHSFPQPGNFSVRLKVDDGSGMDCSAVMTETPVEINASPVPIMQISGPDDTTAR